MSQKQAERLYQHLIEHRSAQSSAQICAHLGISPASFKRALNTLREHMGVTVYAPMHGGYRIDARDKKLININNHWLAPEDITLLLQGYQLLHALSKNSHLMHLMKPVLSKITRMVDGEEASDTSYFEIISPHERINNGQHVPLLVQALQSGQQVQMDYDARSSGQSTRHISPQKLIRYRENWYVLAYCHSRQALRTFACERIQNPQLAQHARHAVAPETLRQFIDSSYGIFGGPKKFTAQITFLPSIAPWIQDEVWHPEQTLVANSDGTVQLHLPIGDNYSEITMDLMRYAKHIQTIAPEALRQQYLSDLKQAMAQIEPIGKSC
jgi:predicted DNA-binding transcriptional regulator YafY